MISVRFEATNLWLLADKKLKRTGSGTGDFGRSFYTSDFFIYFGIRYHFLNSRL